MSWDSECALEVLPELLAAVLRGTVVVPAVGAVTACVLGVVWALGQGSLPPAAGARLGAHLGTGLHPDDATTGAVAVPVLRGTGTVTAASGHHHHRDPLLDLYGRVLPCRHRIDPQGPVGGGHRAVPADCQDLASSDPAAGASGHDPLAGQLGEDRKSTRLNSSHVAISYAVFCLKKK